MRRLQVESNMDIPARCGMSLCGQCGGDSSSPNDQFRRWRFPFPYVLLSKYTTAGCCCQGKKKKTNVGEEYKSLRFLAAALQKTHAPPRTETKTNSRENSLKGEKKKKKKRVVCRSRSRPSVYTQEEELLPSLSFTALSISSSRRSIAPPVSSVTE